MFNIRTFTSFVILCSCVYAPAFAQEQPLDFETEPIAYNGYLFAPVIELEGRYDDNILVQENNPTSDFITSIRPGLIITRTFGRHALSFETRGEVRRFLDNRSENIENGQVALRGRLEAYQSFVIPFEIGYVIEHQERTNRSAGSLTEKPQELQRFRAQTGFIYQPNRFRTEVIGFFKTIRAEDAFNVLTGDLLPGEDRAVDTYGAVLKTSYNNGSPWTPRFTIAYEREDDKNPTFENGSFSGERRDNQLLRFLPGLEMDYKDLVLGTVDVGYEIRSYDDNSIDDISALSFEAELEFKLNPKTSLSFEGGRVTTEDNEILAGVTRTSGRLTLKRELTSRIFLEGLGSISFSDFAESTREDDEYRAGLGLAYIIDKGLILEGRYNYAGRNSTQNGLSYDRNVFLINLRKEFF